MKTPTEFKLNNFDLLRLLAATQVILDHSVEHLHLWGGSPLAVKILNFFPGVPIFFVISGFLISASYERNNNLKDYFRNRILRIFPGLWVCVFFSVIIISLTGVSFLNRQAIAWLPSQLAGIIYTPKFLSNYGFGSYNGSLWTIPVELQFYICLPIVYRLVPKNKINHLLFILLVVFVVFNCLYYSIQDNFMVAKLFRYSFVPHFYLFLIGVIFQRLQLYKSPIIYNKALYWLIGYMAVCLILSGHINHIIFNLIYSVLLAFCVLSLAYTLPATAKKILRTNDISYGIYIYHGLIITVIVQEKLTGNVPVFVIIIMSYILAYLSWIFVEKPFLQMKRKTIRPTTTDPGLVQVPVPS